MNAPRYSYNAINTLALSDTGHFVYLDAWSVNILLSMLSQERSLWLWANDQNPLTESEIDDLDNKISIAQGHLMQTMCGLIMPICSQYSPEGTLICDGTVYNRVDYPNLYDVLDPAFIIDADTFMTPDLRDRFVLSPGSSYAVNSMGGSDTHTQTIGEMPIHSHTTIPHSHTEVTALPTPITIGAGVPAPSAIPGVGLTGSSGVTVNNEGGGTAMNIMPPYFALRYVVVAL
jgi:microcystin-dependent protein